jgi:small subunit ribosomal protein S17
MADEKTPETAPETAAEATPAAPDETTAAPDETTAAPAAEPAAEAVAEPAAEPAPAAPPATRRDRLETRRAQARPAARGQVSPEQREQERQARRAATAKQRRAYRAKLKQRRAAGDRTTTEPLQATAHDRGRPRERQGVVTSAKGDKTITVKIDVVRRHRRYHKILRSTLKLYAHDEANNAAEGDTVRVVECRPMSRTKRWRLTEVLERAK